MSNPQPFEVFGIRYARHEGWPIPVYFERTSGRDTMVMDFFCWVAIGPERTVFIDTGFDADEGRFRGHEFLRCPADTLSELGADTTRATDLVLTHLHYDHAGNLDKFPSATLHLQEKEIAFVTGRRMNTRNFRRAYQSDHIELVLRAIYDRRATLYDGDSEITPGLSIHRVGGHTMGMQVVRVFTKRGWVALASDAIHYYEELERSVPWTNAVDIDEMIHAHDILRDIAESTDHIVAAHDPKVLRQYPAPTADLEGFAVRLDVEPRAG
ncbi:MAG: N-acyl homoserine lactonase family protein [Alphaproteobacteria bacterium]|nr:N-acyl homoserine lactonase family protein [Alphaproteobacteria bacterium]